MVESPAIAFKADPETQQILDLLVAYEDRSRSDVIRRALRLRAEQLGLIEARPRPKPRPRKLKKAVRDA